MTAPEPHNPPLSRRAAREQRERDAERARAAEAAAIGDTSAVAQDEATEVPRHTMPLPVIAEPEPVDTSAPDPAPVVPPAPLRLRTRSRGSARRPAHSTGPTPIRVGARGAAPAPTRRAARTAQLLEPRSAPARHVQAPRRARMGIVAGLTVIASLVLGSTATMTAAMTGAPPAEAQPVSTPRASVSASLASEAGASVATPLPAPVEALPAPAVESTPVVLELCATPAFTTALASGDDAATIAAAGGADAFRAAVAQGGAPCVALDDPARVWVVVNKTRPNAPIDYWPVQLAAPDGVRNEGGTLRADAAAALSAMVAAAAAAGAGDIALQSGFRSYATQESTYSSQVEAQGAEADLSSARPGFSEHQTGLAGDVVACGDGCGSLDDLAATPQGAWIVAHAWEFGWITRYEAGSTPVTGYDPEPWHLRYVGPDLARAYHDGGWHTLEEFFGLPAAPTYLG